jgi:Fic family protein
MDNLYVRWQAILSAVEALEYNPVLYTRALSAYHKSRAECAAYLIIGSLTNDQLDALQSHALDLIIEQQEYDKKLAIAAKQPSDRNLFFDFVESKRSRKR